MDVLAMVPETSLVALRVLEANNDVFSVAGVCETCIRDGHSGTNRGVYEAQNKEEGRRKTRQRCAQRSPLEIRHYWLASCGHRKLSIPDAWLSTLSGSTL